MAADTQVMQGRTLVVAEKPSVARDIARVLGASRRGDGWLEGDRYVITWAIGHLVALCDPGELDERWQKWRRDSLPMLPEQMRLKPVTTTQGQWNTVKRWMSDPSIDRVVCATDSGREGELIFRRMAELAGCNKPAQRLWISSMTDEAIREGFDTLKPLSEYDLLYQSARCRGEADWLVGMNASRAFTLQYNALLSIGRVQTPTLAILCRRRQEIDAFVPHAFYRVIGDFTGYEGTWIQEDGQTQTEDADLAQRVADAARPGPATVESIKTKRVTSLAPLLYDLTELQREANRRFGMTAQKTLSVAQELYEKYKVISYPRTDSRYLTTDLKPKLAGLLKRFNEAPYAQLASKAAEPVNWKRLINDEQVHDHHAIIPTGKSAGSLPPDAQKLYDLVARRFIAQFYPAQEADETEVFTLSGGHRFRTRARVEVIAGWTLADPPTAARKPAKGKKSEGEDEPTASTLPEDLSQGQQREVADVRLHKGETKPPRPHTEATLLTAMERADRLLDDEALAQQLKEGGLGTPATRAATIERIIQVGYAQRSGKAIVPTDKGMALIHVVPEELKSPATTAKWERALERIAQGTMEPDAFLGSIRRFCVYLVQCADRRVMGAAIQPEPYGSRGKRPAAAAKPAAKKRAPQKKAAAPKPTDS